MVTFDAIALEKWVLEVLGVKDKEIKGLRRLERAQLNGDVKSDFF